MTINIDRSIYSDSCITKVVYLLSGRFTINRRLKENVETIFIESNGDSSFLESDVISEFMQKLNDFKLREIIQQETNDIKTILYAKAFGDFDDLNEDDCVK